MNALETRIADLTPGERVRVARVLIRGLSEDRLIEILAAIRHEITVIETARDMAQSAG